MLTFPKSLRTVSAQQHGVVSRAQLGSHGIRGDELARWRARGWLSNYGTNVFRVGGAPITDALRLRAALLDAGPSAVLSHRTAANLQWFGEAVNKQRPIDVTVPRGHHLVRPRLLVHEARDLIAADTVVIGGLRMTSPVRTLVDLAGAVDRAQLTRHADAALAKRKTSTTMLYQRMETLRRRGRVGITLLDDVLADRPDGGLESVFERAFYEIVRSGGLPLPVTQIVFASGSRVIARVDVFFPGGLIVELMSKKWHTSPVAVKTDSIRRRELRLAGQTVIEFWADEVFSNPALVLAELRRHLAI